MGGILFSQIIFVGLRQIFPGYGSTVIPVFVINLDRAKSRWEKCQTSAKLHHLELTRIKAIDDTTPREDWKNTSQFWFSLCHGKRILPTEYGCYQSHLKALDKIISLDLDHAIICEDDVLFNSDFVRDTAEIMTSHPNLEILKLVNNRCHGFKEITRTTTQRQVGYTYFGPLGSAAAYAVSSTGAKKLREAIDHIFLPYDRAMERGWAHDYNILCVKDNWLEFSSERQSSQISKDYAESRYPILYRLPVTVFRIKETLARLLFVFRLKNGFIGLK